MAEGSETPNGEQGTGSEGRARRGEGDLFAERRARRAAESGEVALTRRAEAAEATVQTLERHVASLQQRLREAEEERLRVDELLEAERAAALEREHELRRVKQREYAEQQLRVEAEDHVLSLDRESRVEIERLGVRLNTSEEDASELARRLEGVQRQLAEADQQAGAERAAVRRVEQDLQARLTDLERRALEIQRGLDAERAARERSERLLESMREGHRRMEVLLGEMKGIVARVTGALSVQPRPALAGPSPLAVGPAARGTEMADALASAVERLRARADAVTASAEASTAPSQAAPGLDRTGAEGPTGAVAPAVPTTSRPTLPSSPVAPGEPPPQLPENKHALSWFARRRIKRKQRRELRGQ